MTPGRAPGTAPVFGPCGVDGGNPKGCPINNPHLDGSGCAGGGYGFGPDARAINFSSVITVAWRAGDAVDVGWAIQVKRAPSPLAQAEP